MSEEAAAFGGPGWPDREADMADEIGSVWSSYRVRSEWAPLEAVLLHPPGPELDAVSDPEAALMLSRPDADGARREHEALVAIYRENDVEVHFVEPPTTPPPNQMFCADLLFQTPSGAIVGRPASTVRAGEERWLARKLADLGVPILRTVHGRGTFEGADAAWLDSETVIIGRGLRTNREGARQVAKALAGIGVDSVQVDLPRGTMHLMGELRILDRDLAFVGRERVPWTAVEALRERGYEIRFFAHTDEAVAPSRNVVTLAPRTALVPRAPERTLEPYRKAGVRCIQVEMKEIGKAAGAVGCLSGILSRSVGAS